MASLTGNKPNWARETAIDNVTDMFALTAAAGDALAFPQLTSWLDTSGNPVSKVKADFLGTAITITDYDNLPIGSEISALLLTAGAGVYKKTAASTWTFTSNDSVSSHIVKFAGEVTWSGGGAVLASTIAGVLATDIVVASFLSLGTQGTILQGAAASADTITFTIDIANTGNDAVISYVVYRAI